jgi:hypothetical protein
VDLDEAVDTSRRHNASPTKTASVRKDRDKVSFLPTSTIMRTIDHLWKFILRYVFLLFVLIEYPRLRLRTLNLCTNVQWH